MQWMFHFLSSNNKWRSGSVWGVVLSGFGDFVIFPPLPTVVEKQIPVQSAGLCVVKKSVKKE